MDSFQTLGEINKKMKTNIQVEDIVYVLAKKCNSNRTGSDKNIPNVQFLIINEGSDSIGNQRNNIS